MWLYLKSSLVFYFEHPLSYASKQNSTVVKNLRKENKIVHFRFGMVMIMGTIMVMMMVNNDDTVKLWKTFLVKVLPANQAIEEVLTAFKSQRHFNNHCDFFFFSGYFSHLMAFMKEN